MPTIRFEGASDDLVEVSGPCFYNGEVHEIGEEWPAYTSGGKVALTAVLVDGQSSQMYVHAIYANNGCWTFAPAMVDEGLAIPEWPMRFLPSQLGTDYSLCFEVEVPEGVFAITLNDWTERQKTKAVLGAGI